MRAVVSSVLVVPHVLATTIAYMADTHLGEGCVTDSDGYLPSDTGCYSVQYLRATVKEINRIHAEEQPLAMLIHGGDVSSKAQANEFVAAKRELDGLSIPYIPTMGNHDVWSYTDNGDLTDHPIADRLFGATFADVFESFMARGGFHYENRTIWNPERKCNSTFQSWMLSGGAVPNDPDGDLQGVVFLSPDVNTRKKALPGWNGALGAGELHDFEGGVLPWLRDRLAESYSLAAEAPGRVFLLMHQPLRCRPGVPDWSFCFSGGDKDTLRDTLSQHAPSSVSNSWYWGVLAGHQHRWFDGTAFDEKGWDSFRQWENSGVKGDDAAGKALNMSSSFTLITFDQGEVTKLVKHWQEGDAKVWKSETVSAASAIAV